MQNIPSSLRQRPKTATKGEKRVPRPEEEGEAKEICSRKIIHDVFFGLFGLSGGWMGMSDDVEIVQCELWLWREEESSMLEEARKV
jgi:hypothetical protein